MRLQGLALLAFVGLVALVPAEIQGGGSHEYHFRFKAPRYSSEESQESKESSEEQKDARAPSFYTRDVIHGMGPEHSILTVDFPKPAFPDIPQHQNFQPKFEQPKFEQPEFEPKFQSKFQSKFEKSGSKPEEPKYEPQHQFKEQPRYDDHREQYDRVFGKPHTPEQSAKMSVVRTADGKKITTMTKPGYKMVMEEMEGKPDNSNMKMVGRTVKETNSSKTKGDNGETMHQSQSYQYQVVQSESLEDKPSRQSAKHSNFKHPDIHQFAQQNFQFPSAAQFPSQFGIQGSQFKNSHSNAFVFEAPEAFQNVRIPTGIHRGF